MKFAAVSTFNADGLNLYGRRMMESFARHWPANVELRVYSEGWDGDFDLLTLSPWLAAFKARHRDRKFRDFRWDAVRFAHKVAAVTHAAVRTDADVLIWLDGDVVAHAPLTLADLAGLAPGPDEWIAWLDRAEMYPECGFFMLNCRHPRHVELINALQGLYEDDQLFALHGWTDCHAIEHVVKASGIGAKSLSGPQGHRTTHPIINGPLGAWVDHLKGHRKVEGRSRRSDLKVAREEAWWR